MSSEHAWFIRALTPHSVQHVHDLRLYHLINPQLSQLTRFINSFRSLRSLVLVLGIPDLGYSGQNLSKATKSLENTLRLLDLQLTPGVYRLIDYYAQEGSYFDKIKELILRWPNCGEESKLSSYVAGVEALLRHNASSLTHLTLEFASIPMKDEISDLCEFITSSNEVPLLCVLVVCLSILSGLSNIIYCAARDGIILKYAARQLKSYSSDSSIVEICFAIGLKDHEELKELYIELDDILNTDRFPALCRVTVHERVPSTFFPNLHARGIIMAVYVPPVSHE